MDLKMEISLLPPTELILPYSTYQLFFQNRFGKPGGYHRPDSRNRHYLDTIPIILVGHIFQQSGQLIDLCATSDEDGQFRPRAANPSQGFAELDLTCYSIDFL